MEIQYLKLMQNNSVDPINGYANQGISLTEIQTLEQIYNSGNPFPKVLKEVLFLAGDQCNVLEYSALEELFIDLGWSVPTAAKTMQLMQIYAIDDLSDNGLSMPNRPWFVIDLYNVDIPIFVFLDEGDNPNVYEFRMTRPAPDPKALGHNHIRQVLSPLSELILKRVERMMKGENPF